MPIVNHCSHHGATFPPVILLRSYREEPRCLPAVIARVVAHQVKCDDRRSTLNRICVRVQPSSSGLTTELPGEVKSIWIAFASGKAISQTAARQVPSRAILSVSYISSCCWRWACERRWCEFDVVDGWPAKRKEDMMRRQKSLRCGQRPHPQRYRVKETASGSNEAFLELSQDRENFRKEIVQ